MKIKNSLAISSMFGFALLIPLSAQATEVTGTPHESTPIEIEIIQKPIGISTVQAPTFATYELSGNVQTLQATGDLVIDIDDIRVEDLSGWQVQYGISMFKNDVDDAEMSNQLIVKIGSGKLFINGVEADTSEYDAQSLALSQNKQGMLLQVNTSKVASYEYKVPKENISIEIPKNSVIGEYEAVQTIKLLNLPIIE